MKSHQETCDPRRIELFLQQQLSDQEQTAFESHLDDCDDCRRRLEAAAAGDDIWSGVQESLLSEPSSLGSDVDSSENPATFGHETVLRLLAPTDDERMIGRLGTYEVVGVIGSGGMGVVLKAFDAALNRYVAIKVLAPHLGGSGAARKRFAREAQAAAAVVHDNVIEIHGVADTDGLPYLVMPYVRGPSLQRRLDSKGSLALVEILRIGMQAASGLAAAHSQGLVHRDVKPANILLADGVERAKLTDFGLARAADDASLTRTGVIAGTPQYMSPEQARGEQVDQPSDLFSLGSVLYAMCTGHSPFRAETSYGVLRRITDEEPRPVRQLNPDIPEWLGRIIARLMSKRPEDRFESAEVVAELLEECLAHVQQPTAVALPESLAPQSSGSRFFSISRRRMGVFAMMATFGFALLGMVMMQASAPPDISGDWSGDEWGQVVLESQQPGRYEGSYTDAANAKSGSVRLKWSRVERRFNGTWAEGEDRGGKLSLRLVDDEIRGAWTTNKKSGAESETPRLADLLWTRRSDPAIEKITVSSIRDQAQFHAALLETLQYSFYYECEYEYTTGVKGNAKIVLAGDRFRVDRVDITGGPPLSLSSAYNGKRQQWLDNDRSMLRLKDGNDDAMYGISIPQTYAYLWVAKRGVSSHWDALVNPTRWEERFADATYVGSVNEGGRNLEVVEFPQPRKGMESFCVWKVYFAPDLGYLPIKYVRRVEKPGEVSSTMEVTRFKTFEVDGHSITIPTEVKFEETGADNVSMVQKQTLRVDEESLKVNEEVDDSLFTLDTSGVKHIIEEGRVPEIEVPMFPGLSRSPEEPSTAANLAIENLTFVTKVDSWGVYDPFPDTNFAPGQRVMLYAEIKNFASRETEKGFETKLRGRYEIFARHGPPPCQFELDFDTVNETCSNQRNDYFVRYVFNLPQSLTPDQYVLQLTINDLHGDATAQEHINFSINEEPATIGVPEAATETVASESSIEAVDNRVEVELGEFSVGAYQPITETQFRIDFTLCGTVNASDREDFLKVYDGAEHRLRDEVNTAIRNAELLELREAELGAVRKKILEASNRIFGKPYLKEIVFSEFNFYEM